MADPRPPRKRMRGQCSSDENYDVFLNHRGLDVKAGFIAHLHDALQTVGLNSFLDKKSLTKGGPATLSINAALEAAKVHVAVVSRGYADSKSCLTELAAMMRSEKPVIPVFYDVEPADLRRVNNGQFREAFEKHKSRESDTQQVAEWAAALEKLADTTGFCLSHFQGDEAELKHEVVYEIQRLLPMNKAVQLEQYYVGLNENVKKCVDTLSSHSGLLCLAGMGGIGKTALAREIFNHFVGDKSFKAMSFLEIGRGTPSSSMTSLQQKLLWDLLWIPEQNNSRQSYKECFNKLSRQGPVLIVLDDIYDKVQYDTIIVNKDLLASGSCIIVTSRDQHVLTLISGRREDVYVVKPLGCEDSLKLFNWNAFGKEEAPEYLKVKAHDVSKACGGLPLALKVVGSSLFDKTSDEDIWEEAKDALKGDPNVTNALRWSYDRLSEAEKLMFVDIACVFYGWTKKAALDIWKSCNDCSCCAYGRVPSTSLTRLIDRSLIVLDEHPTSISEEKVLVMHGLLREIGQGIGKNINGSHLWGKKAIQAVEDNHQDSNKIKSLDLSNVAQNQIFHAESFKKMANLHFLILDGCSVSGNFELDLKELRWLRWKCMPMAHLPPMLNLSNLTSLDFSQSTKLAVVFTTSNPALKACPNLLKLNLNDCTSITTLPDSLGHLPRLQVLELYRCGNLQKLPSSIGHLTALQKLLLERCGKLEALPETITALSSLQLLDINFCSSISKLPASFGRMIGLTRLYIDLAADWQVMEVGQLNKLTELGITECTDEVITLLDSLKTLANLKELSEIWFYECPSITNLPQTIVLLPNLEILDLWRCEKLQELHANSIRELKMLKRLSLRYCNSVETLPESLGALGKLEEIWIVKCSSISKLPMSMGQLPSLKTLHLQSCTALRSFPDSFRQLNALQNLQVVDCGSLSGFELVRVLQGLRIWGCTSIETLPEQGLYVVDSNFRKPECLYNYEEWDWVRRNAKELDLVEDHGCGFLRYVQDTETGLEILQRVYKSPCGDKMTV